ncbi:alkane 1-monooxygenase [Kaistella sp. G5-32]|uniref:Alkane 1-monooxygenase n=1 Tax=Kaistella gelatinilytica TaxID=2787636 RepID=A0ABS0FB21_9FLAO|nr:alkane 1-monooxygenase [Kaistella gelatinilytica]MBF8456878.1 alkane 1-monooxygenase [Kaistella gelatinilytica]
MNIKAFKYLSPLIIYILAWISFTQSGWFVWIPLLYVWILIPIIELFFKPDEKNLSATETEIAKKDSTYDYMLYIIVVFQYFSLFKFLSVISTPNSPTFDVIGRIFTMGLLCGTFGINVAHELGHRKNKMEQFFAKALLLTSLYMHFFIEHNKGHHKNVSTPKDPSSARKNEILYFFYFRTIIFSYLSAWEISTKEILKKGASKWSLKNEMLQFQIIQIAFVILIYFAFGGLATLYFLAAAIIGITLLETINYIEHYGLSRKETTSGNYERAMPKHSWNSNHALGRLMLFELSRHSDHHYLASKKYQILDHHDEAPQLPTGYPGSMILALFPPAWFYVMNRKIKNLENNSPIS